MKLFACGLILLVTQLVSAQPEQQKNPFKPFDRSAFEAHLKAQGATDEQMAAFDAAIEEESLAVAADQILRGLFEAYDEAVGKAEDGDPEAALTLTKLLSSTKDMYLQGHIRYHLGRVFLDADDPEQAVRMFADYLRENRNHTPLDAEVVYFYAQSLAEEPDAVEAARVFQAFINYFPDAPERYRSSAVSIFAELESQLDSPLHEIADVMKGVERRIRKTNTGEDTQKRQQDIITKLQKIIEQIEEMENQSGGAPGGLGNPSNPASKSAAPPGPTRIGNLKRVSGVSEKCGMMKDRDRKAIESDLQTKLPGQYRKMLEEYYKKLGTRDVRNR